jgi:archaellum component FlaG (FlaF/FlaG flagellin family)
MATAKKGKKTSSPKKSAKTKKKKANSGFFTKFLLIFIVLSLIAAAVLFTLKNFNIDITKVEKEKDIVKTEILANDAKTKSDKVEVKTEQKNETSVTQKQDAPQEAKEIKKEFKELKTLNGCWHSTEQGAFITIDEYGYRIDFSNVDASKPMTGNYFIENNLITFTSDGNECDGLDGTYRVTFYKKNIGLSCKNDECTDRRNVLEADWEWVEY